MKRKIWKERSLNAYGLWWGISEPQDDKKLFEASWPLGFSLVDS
jgi:hypothetical protein